MIRRGILGIALSMMLSGSVGAGLAACRNWTTGPAVEADTTTTASPDQATTRETDRLWATL